MATSASSFGNDFSHLASDAAASASDAASNVTDKVKSTIASVSSDASRAIRDSIEEQKTAGAEAIAGLARSAQETAEGLRDQAPQIANVVKSVAGRVERVSNDIKDRSLSDMADSMTSFAQRQPVAFLGCGVLAGFVLARLLTAPIRN